MDEKQNLFNDSTLLFLDSKWDQSYDDKDSEFKEKKKRVDPLAGIPLEDGLEVYFRQMSQEPLLNKEQEVVLAKKIEAGKLAAVELETSDGLTEDESDKLQQAVVVGEEAHSHLVQANTRLVVSIAKKYRNRGLAFLDLIQEGNIGLIIAVNKFDYRLGNRFSTYATWWIRQSVSRALANFGRTIRIPSHMHGHISRLYKVVQQLEQEHGRPPKTDEIAKELNMDEAKVRHLMRSASQPMSLEQRIGDEQDSELGDFIADVDAVAPAEEVSDNMLSAEMNSLLDKLTPREARILRLRYGLNNSRPRTLKEVGHLFGLSRERIRQLERSALHKLRSPNIGGDIWQYLR